MAITTPYIRIGEVEGTKSCSILDAHAACSTINNIYIIFILIVIIINRKESV